MELSAVNSAVADPASIPEQNFAFVTQSDGQYHDVDQPRAV